jgi:hypothetical protein
MVTDTHELVLYEGNNILGNFIDIVDPVIDRAKAASTSWYINRP